MSIDALAIDWVPQLEGVPAAYGAITAPMQISGGSVFDIVVAIIVSAP